ncbi:MAG TPA: hypothetical protein VKT80_09600 [Chloroflexota bacterium]|nr:hypothetical protein [Chloroflexota bacterium]
MQLLADSYLREVVSNVEQMTASATTLALIALAGVVVFLVIRFAWALRAATRA